ncbi:MAG: IscS subfamily cysteine desulfurase [Bacteroidota bacterium]|nr:IscS subfamily cysteine desulfurase [Bacteroidota bacterium]MDP4218290.1 IscS subfamily cysteine desulfurase [Bacteroidota bacterium]MDP4245483.1 IscS subfamily cysteine desulfurase [Bacteroidota bacterium]MDP4259970.1 IscS subfamily cysteine desulfurase [Bacteroidota bacterium]
MKLPVYLDHNATTPCDPRVVEAMLPYFTERFGNAASRTHAFGWQAEEAVENAREQVAALIGAGPREIVFTSGATEAVNLAIKGVFDRYASRGNHIITVKTEHKAVIDTCKHLERSGGEVSWLPVDSEGLIDLSELEAAIRPTTILICVMLANNEIGVIQPVREIGEIARRKGVAFFSDATQAVGKLPVDVQADGIDLLALSAHKIYGPKGAGALYVRRRDPRISLTAQMDGGGHERGMRSGTLNVPGIVGLGKACALCEKEMEADRVRIEPMRDRLEQGLLRLDGAKVNGSRIHRLPATTNMSFAGIDGEALLAALAKDVALSSGSACTSASPEPSYVLKALGLDDELAYASLRIGLGRFTTDEEVGYAIERVSETVQRLQRQPS